MLTIREATQSDARILLDFIKKLAAYEQKKPEEVSLTTEKIRQHCFGIPKYFNAWLLEYEGQAVGCLIYCYLYVGYVGAPAVYIENLFIEESFRRRSFGTILLKKLAVEALEKGCCRMEWRCLARNKNAIAFYKKLGAEFKSDVWVVRLQQHFLQELAHINS